MADLNDVLRRLQALEDIEEIKKLKHRYFFHCDQKQPDQVRQCFAEGPIELDYGRVGMFEDREEMVDIFSRLACVEHIVEMHHAQNPMIELQDENNASATWSLYYYMINTRDKTVTQLGGYYDDKYRRTDQGWQITASRFNVSNSTLLDTSEGVMQTVFAGRTPPAEIDDIEQQG